MKDPHERPYNGILYSIENELNSNHILQLWGKSQKLLSKTDTNMYLLHDLMYMEYKIKQNKSMALDARRVVTLNRRY